VPSLPTRRSSDLARKPRHQGSLSGQRRRRRRLPRGQALPPAQAVAGMIAAPETIVQTPDAREVAAALERLLKLRSLPFGMKLFADRAEMQAIPRIRRPQHIHTLDQVVAQAARLGWTVGATAEDLAGAQCRAVVGLGHAKTPDWAAGNRMDGVWFQDQPGAAAHQAAMHCVPDGRYDALVVSPLASGRLDPPDIALFYATPGAMMYFINGLQWQGYKRFDWSVVGESSCADSW